MRDPGETAASRPIEFSRVVLVLEGDVALRIDLGQRDGDCTSEGRAERQVTSSIQCIFGGGEASLAVLRQGRNLILREELVGGAGSRASYRTIAIFPLPPRRR